MADPDQTPPVAYWVVLCLAGLTALSAAAAFLRDRRAYGEPLAAAALLLAVAAMSWQYWATRTVRERRH